MAIIDAEGGRCSGTLLAADLVVTAAHCIEAEPREVLVGSIDVAAPDGHRRAVKWARAYPSWLDAYDVGVIMLENPVFAKHRAVAQGCTTRERFVRGAEVEVVGFGLTTPDASDDNTKLHAATLSVADATCEYDEACVSAIAPGGEFIAGGDGVDACFGDSGGPVYIETSHGPALIGVVSRGLPFSGYPCGDGGVFVRADKVVKWIESVSGRVVARVPCDAPADGAAQGSTQAGGCHAAGDVLDIGLALLAALWCIATMRRIRRVTTRTPCPRSR